MTYYASRPTPSQCASPTRGALVLFLYQLEACFWLVEPLLLSFFAEGGVPCADLSALLEAGIFTLEVLDVSVKFIDEVH